MGIAWLHSACGHCEYCLAGWGNALPGTAKLRLLIERKFAEYALGKADYLGRIPKNLFFADAATILCAGVTTYKGLKMTEARPGEWIVISGVGGLGHVAIQYAKAMGLNVAAVDLGPKRWRWRGNSELKSRLMRKHRTLRRRSKNRSGGAWGTGNGGFTDRLQASGRHASSRRDLRA